MKIRKRIITMAVLLGLMASLLEVPTEVDASETTDATSNTGYLYRQDFGCTMDDLIAEGWSENIADYYHIEDGMLVYNTVADDTTGAKTGGTAKMQVVLGNAIAKTWTNYTLEADVLLTTTYVEGVTGTANVGIALGVNGTNSSGALTDYIGFNISMKSNYVTTGSIVRTGVNAAGDVSTNVQTTLANYAGKSDLDHIKIVVNGNLVTVYMNDEELLSYENEDVSKLSSGSIGFYAQRRQAKFDNIKVYPNGSEPDDNCYEVDFYRSGRATMLHPFKAGSVFAGWYKDADYTEELDATTMTGTAYAKFVAGYLYQQDFSGTLEDLTAEGWSGNTATYFHIENGMLVYNTAADEITNDKNLTGIVLDNAIAGEWTNYTLEADVLLGGSMVSGLNAMTANFGILLGAAGSSGSLGNSIGFNISMNASQAIVTGQAVTFDAGMTSLGTGVSLPEKYGYNRAELNHVKIVIEGNTMTVYMNEYTEPVLTYTDDIVSQRSSGSIAFYAMRRQAKIDNIKVYPNESELDDNCYEVGFYRSERDSKLHPFKAGSVFAGWYKDAEYTEALAADTVTGSAYAKWVDEEVLSVKAQIKSGTTTESSTTDIRFVTTVDSLDYQNVGMKINGGGKEIDYITTSVYKQIAANEGGIQISYGPTKFSEYSKYFATVTVNNIPVSGNLDKAITVTPYWTTTDGTYVAGVIRNDITIRKGIETDSNSNE